jgi:tetratricopeptide (TPR) repeat protein
MRGRSRPAGDLGLDAEVDELEQAIRLSELDGGEDAALLNALAVALRRRYTAAGQRPDLERALDSARQAVAAATAPSVHAVCLNTVGNCLADRFGLAGRRADLDAAIDAYRLAASEAPDPDDRRAFAANLAGAMADRFRFDGRSDDLDAAIEVIRGIRAEGMESRVEQAGLAANYASLLQLRYATTGRMDDLDEAVDVARGALGDAQEDAYTLMILHLNAGGALLSRYERSKNRIDLAAAIEELTAGVLHCPEGAPDRASLDTNLGVAFGARARTRSGSERRADMDTSVTHHRLALEEAEVADRPLHANGLASALFERYQETWDRRDLRSAVRLWRRLVAETPRTSPLYARRLGNLARGMALSADVGRRPWTVLKVRRSYRRSCRSGLLTDPESSLFTAKDWAEWALRRESTCEATEGFGLAVDALEQLFRRQVLRMYKEAWLRAAPGIYHGAAWAHASCQDPRSGALALERGRAHLLSEALQRDRTDLRRLAATGGPALAARYTTAVERLAAAQASAHSDPSSIG